MGMRKFGSAAPLFGKVACAVDKAYNYIKHGLVMLYVYLNDLSK